MVEYRVSRLTVAICQFAPSGDAVRNGEIISRQLEEAKALGADVAHFFECALTGYPNAKEYDFAGFDWEVIRREEEALAGKAAELSIWLLLPSAHRLSKGGAHNSVYVIDPNGAIVDRYDKRFPTQGELATYTPGDHASVFQINGVTCGIIICYEKWFPGLIRDYRRQGVELIFDSIHSQERDFSLDTSKECLPDHERALWIAYARLNHIWMSVSNHALPTQDNTSFLVDPDGRLQKLPFKEECVRAFTIDTEEKFWDPGGPLRGLDLEGRLSALGSAGSVNGEALAADPRHADRHSF